MNKNADSPTSALRTAILLMGAGGMIGQLILIRVLMVVFYGNELTLAVAVTGWLLAEAAGAWSGGRLSLGKRGAALAFTVLLVVYSLVLPAAIILARSGFGIRFGLIAGEGLALNRVILTVGLTAVPVSFLHGALFPLGSLLLHKQQDKDSAVSRAYLLEILGSVAAGAVFVFTLAPYFTALQIAAGLFILHLLTAVWLEIALLRPLNPAPHKAAPRILITAATAAMAITLAPGTVTSLQKFSLNQLWPKGEVISYRNSPYGNIAVIEHESQYTVRYDGRPMITLPYPDTAHLQDYAWLAALAHPSPVNTMVIGSGLGGLLYYLLEHPIERAVYTEIDPYLPKELQALDSSLMQRELTDPRTEIITREPATADCILIRQKTGSISLSWEEWKFRHFR